MRTRTSARNVALIGLVSLAATVLHGCGGGGGGGSGAGGSVGAGGSASGSASGAATGGGGNGFSPVYFGSRAGGVDSTLQAYPVQPLSGVPIMAGSMDVTVPAPNFTAGAASQSYLEFYFSKDIRASSVSTGANPPAGTEGIVVYYRGPTNVGTGTCALGIGHPVCFRLDLAGQVEASNATPAGTTDTAPGNLRLYYDPDNDLTTANTLPAGDYTVVITSNLRAADGGVFAPAGTSGLYPVFPFSVGGDTSALAASPPGEIVPINGATNVKISSEINIKFNDAVDFVSLCGGTLAGVTSLDPFVSRPALFAAGVANVGNLTVAYTLPIDPTQIGQPTQPLPPTLGIIAYMPSPVQAPNQIRIRFVDVSTLVGANTTVAGNPPTYQNYASGVSPVAITSTDPTKLGTVLSLPAIKNVPGSFLASNNSVNPASVSITVVSAAGMAAVNGGVKDRGGNPMNADFLSQFTWEAGPRLSRNSVGPDQTLVLRQQGTSGLGSVNSSTAAGPANPTPGQGCTQRPAWATQNIGGALTLDSNPLLNPSTLGVPIDATYGTFLAAGGASIYGARTTQIPGVANDQNGTTPSNLPNCINPMMFPTQIPQPLGCRLYVVDGTDHTVKVFNSFDFSLVTTLVGIASPNGLGIAPDLSFLYIANGDQGTVQRVYANPNVSQFHTVANTITVGQNPGAITVSTVNETIFVSNFAENSVSIITVNNQTEKLRLATGFGPSDIFITSRMLGMGLTNEYQAFIENFYGNSVTVYESAGGGVVLENQPNGKKIAEIGGFLGPRHGTWNWRTYLTVGGAQPGCYVANSLGNTVDELTMFNFTLSPPPGIPGPAGRREFNTHKQFNGALVAGLASPSDCVIDNMTGLYNFTAVGVTNNKAVCDVATGGGHPSVLLVSYPGAGKVVAFNIDSPSILGSLTVPGCDLLNTYYDQ